MDFTTLNAMLNGPPILQLATLFGSDHDKNRDVWNAWVCQNVDKEEIRLRFSKIGKEAPILKEWSLLENEVRTKFERISQQKSQKTELPTLSNQNEILQFSKMADVSLEGRIFTEKIDISDCEAGKTFDLSGAYFLKRFVAKKAEFGDFYADHCVFFSHCILENSTFGGLSYFSETHFNSDAVFASSRFANSAEFSDTTFFGQALFQNINFEGFADFRNCVFERRTSFGSATFHQRTNFASAKFNMHERGPHAPLTFDSASFNAPTSFLNARFSSTYPDLGGALLHANTFFSCNPSDWPSSNRIENLERAKRNSARIRHIVGQQGLYDEEHFFFRKEMDFTRNVTTWLHSLPYRVFGRFSNFGYSIERPLICLSAMIIAFSGFFASAFRGMEGSVWWLDLLTGLGMSFANAFRFFGFQRQFYHDEMALLTPALEVLAGIETVLGYILLFFLGLGLRQRFRLR